MPLGGFGLISMFYVVMGVHFATQFWPRRKEVFDSSYSAADRAMITRAAFFFLVPISVLLHEMGHAVVIKLFGGEIVDFGFYVFAGYVSYDPRGFTDTQQMLVAFAGTFVNMVLILVALWIALVRTPALSAPWNDLLIQFALISGLNALIAYPLLDYAWDINGDWSQMYDGGVPWLTAVIVILQVGFIAFGVILMRNPKARALIARRTGGQGTSAFEFARPSRQQTPRVSQTSQLTPNQQTMVDSSRRVASGWQYPIESRLIRHPHSSILALRWESGGANRFALLELQEGGALSLRTLVQPLETTIPSGTAEVLKRWPEMPNGDDLTMALRMAMESTERQPVKS